MDNVERVQIRVKLANGFSFRKTYLIKGNKLLPNELIDALELAIDSVQGIINLENVSPGKKSKSK